MEAVISSSESAEALRARVVDAVARHAPLVLRGSGSKGFLGNAAVGEPLELRDHAGIVSYAPGELVITARAGTRLADIEAALAERDQMLAFEPPHLGPDATLGGTIACGLSGPRRANAGAVRDFVLGARILDGRGRVLRFGGEVIKNVAGYDVSRLMVGAFGTLGVLLDVSLRVVPRPRVEATHVLELAAQDALDHVRGWALRPLPISASAILDGRLYVRLSGAESALRAAKAEIGGEIVAADAFWRELREQELAFFAGDQPLWRLSVAPGTPIVDAGGAQLIEWHGAQRWLRSDRDAQTLRTIAASAGGHATLFRAVGGHAPRASAFHPLPAALLALHQRLKAEFDPHGLFNRGRLYADL